MLVSADILNTLTPAIDQLLKRTDDVYECKSWATAYVEFHLNSTYSVCVNDCWYFIVRWKKINWNSCVTANL